MTDTERELLLQLAVSVVHIMDKHGMHDGYRSALIVAAHDLEREIAFNEELYGKKPSDAVPDGNQP